MTAIQIELPRKLIPVFTGRADVRGAYGGRGSAKTRSFAKMAALEGYRFGSAGISGIILCARQFMNSIADSSLEEVKRAIEDEPFLVNYYDIGEKYIKSKDGRISFAFAGLDRNIASIKSKGRLLLCWIDEAEPVTEEAFQILVPTLREEGTDWNAELWITWNPVRENASVEKRYRNSSDPLVKVAQINWRDNPKFPAKLERDRQRDLELRPDDYDWIWEGAYKSVVAGAVYGKEIKLADTQNRFTKVPYDLSKPVHTFWDLGRADKTSIWFAQIVGFEFRIIDFYENQGFALNHYLKELQSRDYVYGDTWLPHDAQNELLASERTIEQQAKAAGFKVRIAPKVSIADGINAARTIFPNCWFDKEKCLDGITCLRNYRYEVDEETKQYSKNPVHDWASHAADAFRYLAIALREPKQKAPINIQRSPRPNHWNTR